MGLHEVSRTIMYSVLREVLEEKRGERIADADWDVLVFGREISTAIDLVAEPGDVGEATGLEYIDDVAPGLLRSIGLLETSRRLRAERMRQGREREVSLAWDRNAEAVAMLAAEEARRDENVILFRSTHLVDGLVETQDVPRWVAAEADRDGTPSKLMLIPVDAPSVPRTSSDARDMGLRFYSTSRLLLEFPSEDEGWRGVLAVRLGGVLNQLRTISETLASHYGWQPAQATGFVLSDAPPIVAPIQVQIQDRSWRPSARIVLTIDPLLPPKEVAATYRHARTEFYTHGDASRQEPNYTQISSKRAALAVFALKYSQGHVWAEAQSIWNRDHPEWAYSKSRAAQFIRDARDAYKRVSGGRDLDWRGLGGDE